MSTLPCVDRPGIVGGKTRFGKAEILPSCCMSSIELLGSLNRSNDPLHNAGSPNSSALDNKKEQRLRQAIKAEMLSF